MHFGDGYGADLREHNSALSGCVSDAGREREKARTDLLVTLENVQPPPDEGLTSLGRLVVLEQSARSVRILDRVRRGSKQPRRVKVRLRLVFRRRGWGCRARP